MAKQESSGDATLFPIINAAPTGLARLAAQAETSGVRHQIEFKTLETRSILNRSLSKRRLSLSWSINPYRGCEFACRYCYARYTHEFLEPAPIATTMVKGTEPPSWATAFERTIFVKKNAAWLLEQDLRRVDPSQEIALGTATDPYQPIERTERVTRSLLEVFSRQSGYRLGIVTKSDLIVRDIDLLTQIAKQNTLVLHVTITTVDRRLARLLEPRAPRPDLRLGAIRRLRDAGLTAGVLCSPLLPGLTDTEQALDATATRAAEAGASFFAAEPLFLKSSSRPTYLNFIRENFPALLSLYEEHFRTDDFAHREYRQRMEQIVAATCRRHSLRERSSDALLTRDVGRRTMQASTHAPAQQRLFA